MIVVAGSRVGFLAVVAAVFFLGWFDAAGATTLHVARVRSGNAGQCPRP